MPLALKVFSFMIFFVSASLSATTINASDNLHLDWLDTKVAPGENFYRYANGTWQKNNPIPPDYSSWSTFNSLQQQIQDKIHDMLIKAAANKQAVSGSIEQKIGDFYYSGMDEDAINKLGVTPLQSFLDRINSIQSYADLQTVITELQLIGVDALFGFGSMTDYKNSKRMIGVAMQGGLGLPDRDYYLSDDPKFKAIRDTYLKHITRVFELAGDNQATAKHEASVVMVIETALAKVSMSQVKQRDIKATFNIMDRKQLEQLTPNFSWPTYFAAIGLAHIKSINVGMPDFFKEMSKMLQVTSLEDWKIYLRWHLYDAFASYLAKPWVDENFNMVTALSGAQQLLPRWKRVVNTENSLLGFAIGKLYVEKYFSQKEKQTVLAILHNIRQALQLDLKTLSWMTPATRQAALKKLALMEERVGYPDKWRDYSKLKIDRGPYVLNIIRANQFLIKRDLNKIDKPVDRDEWGMTPQTINAYYDPSMNNINIPAGILQPPFFDPNAPEAVNYGSIGFVIGHEITHGFDDQGAQFDGHGNLENWWAKEDWARFHQATECIVKQYSGYKVDGLAIQGNLVVGEATADLGGVLLAYLAFHHSQAYKQAKTIDGFTPDQQFFLGVAHVWASNIRPEQLRNAITLDPHPPAAYRVNGTLANIPQFAAAFGIKKPSPMINDERCVIW
ncbi:metallopeptidase PepO, peptidase, M13 family [Legionella beliardensis]|uniref:Metallopeptidase PepO, peptidase, M13 family n=1 Tax=Legionella beliardensis TaxID=91822 RepID=A0A378I0T4_9GAMM|nr:M13 family metallopeptidase [Legionella beliardensis]STX28206.1 metallopeptidase PepO, peptidase, M13 family [Legionella beliardensis]